ncbi:MAG: dsDNA nuclease domain-containing protein [Gammaproteobacteria bacterium]
MSAGQRLGHVEPRERAGSQTGRKYEYQYERTARAALELLSDGGNHMSVYCDWHDDYVIEMGTPPTRYVFHQVKGRKTSQGPWTFREFFGTAMRESETPTKKPATVNEKAIVPLMLLHYRNFSESCAGIAFVTNAGLDPSLWSFLNAIGSCTDVTAIPTNARNAFDHLARAYVAAAPPHASSATELLGWLRGMTVRTDQGQIDGADTGLLEIADVVVNYSEIDLSLRQTKQIAREMVSLVRGKVGHSTTVVPASDEQLRREKGIVVGELLGVLSLSAQAYEALKAGAGSDTVKTLSRLQRFCRIKNLDQHLGNL